MKIQENNNLDRTLTAEKDGQGSVNVHAENSDGFRTRMLALVDAIGSVAEIARKCGIPESTVKKWADGISDPSRGRCVALARGTGASVLWLVAGEGPMWECDALALRIGVGEGHAGCGSQTVRLDRETMMRSERILTMALDLAEAHVGPSTRALMLCDVYEHLLSAAFSGDLVIEVNQSLQSHLQKLKGELDARSGQNTGPPVGPGTPE